MDSYNPFTLANKKILVTGASSGIGRAVAVECSRMGAQVTITGRNEQRLNETFDALYGSNHMKIIADLSDAQDISILVNEASLLDGIVHCAGIRKIIPFQFTNKEHFDRLFEVNFFAPIELSEKLLNAKKVLKGASIVFISSISGNCCSTPGNSVYSATKGAINGVVKGMAVDLSYKKIRVNAVLPGMIESTLLLEEGVFTEEQINDDINKYPLKRYGMPKEVAYAVVYLLSDASSWVTGSNLLIDGGYTLL